MFTFVNLYILCNEIDSIFRKNNSNLNGIFLNGNNVYTLIRDVRIPKKKYYFIKFTIFIF